jgi:hypothetical protein
VPASNRHESDTPASQHLLRVRSQSFLTTCESINPPTSRRKRESTTQPGRSADQRVTAVGTVAPPSKSDRINEAVGTRPGCDYREVLVRRSRFRSQATALRPGGGRPRPAGALFPPGTSRRGAGQGSRRAPPSLESSCRFESAPPSPPARRHAISTTVVNSAA